MKCINCGTGWISTNVVKVEGMQRVGLRCNQCDFVQVRLPGQPFSRMAETMA